MTQAIKFKQGKTPLGHLLIATQADALVYAEFGETPAAVLEKFQISFPEDAAISESDALLERTWRAYQNYLSSPGDLSEIPVRISGTEFQKQVWEALEQLPVGSRQPYSALAESIGQPTAVRAVASACARNSIALRIPCHRILRSDGALGGYRWGLAMKQRLLNAERYPRAVKVAQSALTSEAADL